MKSLLFIMFTLCITQVFPASYPEGNNYYCNRLANAGEFLWIASNQGLIRYEKKTGKSELYTAKVDFHDSSVFTCVYTDKENNLWFGTKDSPLTKYNGIYSNVYIPHPNDYLYNCTHFYWYSLAFDSQNKLWSGTTSIFLSYDKESKERVDQGNLDLWGNEPFYIMDMEFDSKGQLWIAADSYYVHLACRKTDGSINFVLSAHNSQRTISSLAIDSEDNIWYVCEDGIHHYNQTNAIDTHYAFDNYPDIPSALYTACEIDHKGNIWFTSSHYLLKYDGSKFTSYNCYGYDKACSLLCDGDMVWIYTANDDVFCFENEQFNYIHIETGSSNIVRESSEIHQFTVTSDENGIIRISGNIGIISINVYNVSGTLILSSPFDRKKNVAIESNKLVEKEIYLFEINYSGGKAVIKTVIK